MIDLQMIEKKNGELISTDASCLGTPLFVVVEGPDDTSHGSLGVER